MFGKSKATRTQIVDLPAAATELTLAEMQEVCGGAMIVRGGMISKPVLSARGTKSRTNTNSNGSHDYDSDWDYSTL